MRKPSALYLGSELADPPKGRGTRRERNALITYLPGNVSCNGPFKRARAGSVWLSLA